VSAMISSAGRLQSRTPASAIKLGLGLAVEHAGERDDWLYWAVEVEHAGERDDLLGKALAVKHSGERDDKLDLLLRW
jgi:hypothetical protein